MCRGKAVGLEPEQPPQHRTALAVVLGFGEGVSVTAWGKEALFYCPGLASLHFRFICGFCL